MQYQNVFDAIANDGHDEFFAPTETEQFVPTDAAPGSHEKIALLRKRVSEGLPLWHQCDRGDYSDLIGAVPPRHT